MHSVRATDFFGPKQGGGSAGALTRLVRLLIGDLFPHSVECVRADRSPSPGGEDDRVALEIALAATKSLKSGRPVELRDER